MNKTLGLGCLAVAVLGLFVLLAGGCTVYKGYNNLVTLNEGVNKQWANVENVYQRRMDLIPNLVSTVTGQANFEKSTLTEIADARASVGRVQLTPGSVPDEATLQKFETAQSQLGGALGRLMVVSENYPQLKANEGFNNLQAELAGTENRISVERGRFNESAQGYNIVVNSLPAKLYAGALGFSPKAYFKSSAGAAEPPKVQFDFSKQVPAARPVPAPAPTQSAPAAPSPTQAAPAAPPAPVRAPLPPLAPQPAK